jgi:antitoxin Phd
MKTATATEVKTKFGQYLDIAQKEPVMIEKSGRNSVVLISAEEYAHLQALEDRVWAEKTMEAAKSGFLGSEASMVFLKEMMEKHADTESE